MRPLQPWGILGISCIIYDSVLLLRGLMVRFCWFKYLIVMKDKNKKPSTLKHDYFHLENLCSGILGYLSLVCETTNITFIYVVLLHCLWFKS